MNEECQYKRLVQKYIKAEKPQVLSEDNFTFTKSLIKELEGFIKDLKTKTFGFNDVVTIKNKFISLKNAVDK